MNGVVRVNSGVLVNSHLSVNRGPRVGLDIGATKTLGAVLDADGTVVAQARRDTLRGG